MARKSEKRPTRVCYRLPVWNISVIARVAIALVPVGLRHVCTVDPPTVPVVPTHGVTVCVRYDSRATVAGKGKGWRSEGGVGLIRQFGL